MKKIVLLFYVGLIHILLVCCQTHSAQSSFGEYYKIGDYGVNVPFVGKPHASPKQDNEILTHVDYQYALPKLTDDKNYLYGVSITKFRNDQVFHDINSKIDYCVSIMKVTIETALRGQVVNEEKSQYRGQYCIRQKAKVNLPGAGETYINSIYFIYNGVVIRLYTFTLAENDKNDRINNYFDSIKLD